MVTKFWCAQADSLESPAYDTRKQMETPQVYELAPGQLGHVTGNSAKAAGLLNILLSWYGVAPLFSWGFIDAHIWYEGMAILYYKELSLVRNNIRVVVHASGLYKRIGVCPKLTAWNLLLDLLHNEMKRTRWGIWVWPWHQGFQMTGMEALRCSLMTYPCPPFYTCPLFGHADWRNCTREWDLWGAILGKQWDLNRVLVLFTPALAAFVWCWIAV